MVAGWSPVVAVRRHRDVLTRAVSNCDPTLTVGLIRIGDDRVQARGDEDVALVVHQLRQVHPLALAAETAGTGSSSPSRPRRRRSFGGSGRSPPSRLRVTSAAPSPSAASSAHAKQAVPTLLLQADQRTSQPIRAPNAQNVQQPATVVATRMTNSAAGPRRSPRWSSNARVLLRDPVQRRDGARQPASPRRGQTLGRRDPGVRSGSPAPSTAALSANVLFARTAV